jgi:hypothetical protein
MQIHPSDFERPRSVAGATLVALLAAAVILVTIVLPAEYGIDWTGIGKLTGLQAMGQDKVKAAKEGLASAPSPGVPAKASAAPLTGPTSEAPYASEATTALRSDAVEIPLAPGAEIEYKAILAEGEVMVYEWDAGGAEVRFDFHGEPAAGPANSFLSFKKGAASKGSGSLRAPFTGTHGWYWKNVSSQPVTIKLRVTGFHTELKRL